MRQEKIDKLRGALLRPEQITQPYLPGFDVKTVREEVLLEAADIITHDRNSSHGDPEDNFRDIAAFWNIYMGDRLAPGGQLKPYDVAAFMILVKMARVRFSPHRRDHWVDTAGYAGCGCEVAQE